jgi:hypothetical protein
MATYIQGQINTPVVTTPYAPDYSFLDYTLKTKENQYEQGFAQVKNLYNSVLNSKVTNAENAEQQKKYLAEIENKFKNLSSVDLSIESNVSAANQVFQPFLKDNDLISDISITKYVDNQLATGQSLMTSEDEKKRKMHSSISDEYVGLTLKDLKNAHRGDGSIGKVKTRQYIPAVDLGDKFKDFLKVNNYGFVSETRDGQGIIVKDANGKNIQVPLYNLMNGLLTGDERKYFDAWGEVNYNRSLDALTNNGVPLQNAKQQLAESSFLQQRKYVNTQYDAALTSYNTNKDLLDKLIKKNNDSFIPGSEEYKEYARLKTITDNYKSAYEKYADEKSEYTDDKKEAKVNDLVMQGWGPYANDVLDRSLRSIASGMAGLTASREVKKDDAYWEGVRHSEKLIDQEQNSRKLDIDERELNMKATGVLDASGNATGLGGGTTTSGAPGRGKKLSEEEIKVLKANAPKFIGPENLPDAGNLDKTKTFQNIKSDLITSMVAVGHSLIDGVLGEEFEKDFKGGLKTITQKLMQKRTSKTMSDEVVEFQKRTNVLDQTEQDAFDRFKTLYGDDFNKFVKASHATGPATYADMQGFLYQKALGKFNDGVTNKVFSSKKLHELGKYVEGYNVLNDLNGKLDVQQKQIEDAMFNSGKIDKNLITLDADGYKRLMTKEELKKKYEEANTTIGYQQGSQPGGFGMGTFSQPIPITKNPQLAKQLGSLLQNYDIIYKKVNEQTYKDLPSFYFTMDENDLKQFKNFSLLDLKNPVGEVAETAISELLADPNISSIGTENATNPPNISIRDYDELSGSNDKVASKYLQDAVTLLRGNWKSFDNNVVEYNQFSGVRGDDRKKFVVRFGDGLSSLIKDYTGKDATDDEKMMAFYLKQIQIKGLTIRPENTQKIAGNLDEYGVRERYFQKVGKYDSPKMFNDLFQYTIRTKADGTGYQLNEDAKYYVKDTKTGDPVPIPLTDFTFPPESSYQSISRIIEDYVMGEIKTSEDRHSAYKKLLETSASAAAAGQKPMTAEQINKILDQQANAQ